MEPTPEKILFQGKLNEVETTLDEALKRINLLWEFQACRFSDEDITQINITCKNISQKVALVRKMNNEKFARITNSFVDKQ